MSHAPVAPALHEERPTVIAALGNAVLPAPRVRALSAERIALVAIAAWIPLQLWYAWPALLATPFDGPWQHDPSIFVYEGALLRNGAMPYVDFWDHKGPLIYLINAAGLSVADGRLWGVWAAGLLAVWVACVAGYAALRLAFGVPGAMAGIVFFLLAMAGIETTANMTEQYALPLAWGSAWLLVRWTHGVSSARTGIGLGILAALAFFLRANLGGAAASAALIVALVEMHARSTRSVLHHATGILLGVVLVCIPVLGWLANAGALGAFWEQAILYNLHYSQADWSQRGVTAVVGLWMASATAPLTLPFAGAVFAVRRLVYARSVHRRNAVLAFALFWLLVELLLASVSGRPYDHYFMMLLPPMATLTAALASAIQPDLFAALWRRVPLRVLTATVAALMLLRPLIDRVVTRTRESRLVPNHETSQVALTADFVRANSGPADRLLVWGLAGGVHFLADRPPATRFLFAFPLLTPGYGESAAPVFLDEVRRSAPLIIVDASVADPSAPSLAAWDPTWRYPSSRWYAPFRSMTPELRPFYDFVASNYRVIGVVGPKRWTVYRANVEPHP